MTVAFDAAVPESLASQDPQDFTHTPVGTPRGVLVLISNQTATSTDVVVGVTYGGVAMTRIRSNVDTTTEPGRVYIYFLGSSIPTGAQTVSIDKTSAVVCWATCVTLTAAADTEVIDHDGIDNNVADPQVTLQYGGREALAVCVLMSGTATNPVGTLLSGMSRVADGDAGAYVHTVDRQTTAGTTDFTIGYTLTSDDVAFSAVAVAEVAGSQTVSPSGASIAITGQTALIVLGTVLSPAAGSIAITGQTSAIVLGERLSPAAAAVSVTGQTPSLVLGTVLSPAAASVALTTSTPTVTASDHQVVAPSSASVAVTGQTPTVGLGINASPAAASIAVTTGVFDPDVFDPDVFYTTAKIEISDNQAVSPAAAAISVTSSTPTVVVDVRVSPDAASIAVTGQTPTVETPTVLVPAAASVLITGNVPLISVGDAVVVSPAPATVAVTTSTPTIALSDHQTVAPAPATVSVTGQIPSIVSPVTVAPSTATITITGQVPIVFATDPQTASPDVALIVITGQTPTVTTAPAIPHLPRGAHVSSIVIAPQHSTSISVPGRSTGVAVASYSTEVE
jgi:hypothetical protein